MSAPAGCAVLVTCEHGGNRVPAEWRALFQGHDALLRSHRGWDPGALAAARVMARALSAPLVASRTTRLLVDLNRASGRAWSPLSRPLPRRQREGILQAHWRPYREAVESRVSTHVQAGQAVLHVSMHSFTPVLDDVARNADVGLLYDPSRGAERAVADAWAHAIRQLAPALRVRRNYPYLGIADGLATHLRRRFDGERYAGIELELNQALATGPQAAAARRTVATALKMALTGMLERAERAGAISGSDAAGPRPRARP